MNSSEMNATLSRTIKVSNEEVLAATVIPEVDEQRYTAADDVWDALASGHVKALRLSWLLQQGLAALTLARCQDLPPAAFVDVDELRRLLGDEDHDKGNGVVLPLIAVGSRSLSAAPTRAELAAVCAALTAQRAAYTAFGFTEMGVIWPWASFCQPRGSGELPCTAAEEASYQYALGETMDLWFAHRGISAVLLDDPPASCLPGYRSAYESNTAGRQLGAEREDARPSGWAAFARLAAEQQQKWHTWCVPWDMVHDLATPSPPVPEAVHAEVPPEEAPKAALPAPPRHWPVGPAEFDQLCPVLGFDTAAECRLATSLFRKASTSTLGTLTFLNRFDGLLPPRAPEAARLGACCNHANRLQFLDLQVSVRGARRRPALPSRQCPLLAQPPLAPPSDAPS